MKYVIETKEGFRLQDPSGDFLRSNKEMFLLPPYKGVKNHDLVTVRQARKGRYQVKEILGNVEEEKIPQIIIEWFFRERESFCEWAAAFSSKEDLYQLFEVLREENLSNEYWEDSIKSSIQAEDKERPEYWHKEKDTQELLERRRRNA